MSVPAGYRTVETDERVPYVDPALRTRFERRAHRCAAILNADRIEAAPGQYTFRWQVVREGGRWLVVAFQNRLEPIE